MELFENLHLFPFPIHSSVAAPSRPHRCETPVASQQPKPGADFLLWCLTTGHISVSLFLFCAHWWLNTHFPSLPRYKAFLIGFSPCCSEHYFSVPLVSSIHSLNYFFKLVFSFLLFFSCTSHDLFESSCEGFTIVHSHPFYLYPWVHGKTAFSLPLKLLYIYAITDPVHSTV